MKKALSIAFAAVALSLSGTALLQAGVTAFNGNYEFTTAAGQTVTISFLNDSTIKVTNKAPGERDHLSRAIVATPASKSYEAVTEGVTTTITMPQANQYCARIAVEADQSTGAVKILVDGETYLYDSGVRTLADNRRAMQLTTIGGGAFYGAGERGYSLDLTGDTLVMYNKQNYGYTAGEQRIKQMNITMPMFVSNRGYAVVFDDYAAAELTLSNPLTYITESPDPVSYIFIYGGSMEETVKRYTEQVGRQELPPFWSLGYITSKYGYKTEAETRGVVDTLKQAGYPLDGIVLDLYWYGVEEDMGRLEWDPEQWPTYKQMLADLKAKGVNLVAISQPYVLRNGRAIDNYNYLAPRGMFVADSTGMAPQEVKIWVGEGGMFDVSNPETRSWLRDRYRQHTIDGVTGWWGDLGEPEVHPETGRHHNGLTARQYHNQYGNDWSEIIYDLFKEEFPADRLMTMMRGGTLGLQRYDVFPWSTDVSRSWGGLQPQVTIMLNSGLSGLGYMSHDVGGFAIDPENPVDPELYVRWLQLGTFSPILRTHAQQVAEPYHYTEYPDIILPLIRERYRWLPYNYTLAWENASAGLPLVRPINFYYATDDETARLHNDVNDQYLWGEDVMVAPVLTQGATSRRVVMPEDNDWIDLNNPTVVYAAGDTITYEAPLSVLPMFVREGAIIPTADYLMENTGDYRTDRYTLNVYLSGSHMTQSCEIYEDDRSTPSSSADHRYDVISVIMADTNDNLTFDLRMDNPPYSGANETKEMSFIVHNYPQAPASITVDGKKVAADFWKYDAATRELRFTVDWTPAYQVYAQAGKPNKFLIEIKK